jgi:hypothetical protein
MTIDQWEQLVLRLNANFPGQQVEPLTAIEWFGPLSGFPAPEVWAALDVLRRTSEYLPSLKAILAAVDGNWRAASAERRELENRQVRAARNAAGGVPMPPETKEALQVLKASMSPPGTPDHIPGPLARERIEALAEQLTARVDLEKLGQLT